MDGNKISVGNSGEYFVAAELERRGYTCAVPMSNTKDFDILAIRRDNNHQYAIQVKTTSKGIKHWQLSAKNEQLIGDNIIYVFVVLNGLATPEYHIVPSAIVANYIYSNHRNWLATPGRNGQKHKDTPMRTFEDKSNEYLDKWELLK